MKQPQEAALLSGRHPDTASSQKKEFWILFVENFFFFSSHAALNSLPVYFSQLGLSHAFTGFFMNIHVFGLVVFVVFFSQFTERIGKKRMILFSYTLAFFAFVFMFFFSTDLVGLVVFRLVSSLSYAVGFTVNAALAFDILPPEKRSGGIALFGVSGILSNPFCSFLGGYVFHFSPAFLFLLAALFTLLAIGVSFFLPEKTYLFQDTRVKHFFHVLKRRHLWLYFFLAVVLGGAFSSLATFIPQQTLERFGVSLLTEYFGAYSFMAIVCRFLFAPWLDRISGEKLLFAGFFLAGLAMLNTAFVYLPWQVLVTGMLYGLAHTILYPVLSAFVVKKSQEVEKYTTNSAFIGFYTLGGLVISSVLGVIGDIFRTRDIFLGMGFLSLGTFVALVVGQREVFSFLFRKDLYTRCSYKKEIR